MDVDSVKWGADFHIHLRAVLSECSAVLVIIGKRWLIDADSRGKKRLDQPGDLVRAEIVTALEQEVPVIPVLVQGATMPLESELPNDLRPLVQRNAIDLSGAAWRAGIERLIEELDRVMKPSSGA